MHVGIADANVIIDNIQKGQHGFEILIEPSEVMQCFTGGPLESLGV